MLIAYFRACGLSKDQGSKTSQMQDTEHFNYLEEEESRKDYLTRIYAHDDEDFGGIDPREYPPLEVEEE